MTTRVLVPSGVLGLGFDREALQRGIEMQPDIICIDGGSTDSGPYYLGTGTSKYSEAATRSEWRDLMLARETLGVPLVLTTCGTCGADSAVDWMHQITAGLAAELGQSVSICRLYSEQSANRILRFSADGLLQPLQHAPELPDQCIRSATHIVALAGAEHIQAALATGADIILAGRATDTAGICALALSQGKNPGAAWHGAKIAECGALCSTNPTSGVIILDIDEHGFEVEPMAKSARCTPETVSAHMLYENTNPFLLHEPGGTLDVTDARYLAINERRVRVEGSKWLPAEHYTVKIEAAGLAGWQSTLMATLRNRRYVTHAQEWINGLTEFVRGKIRRDLSLKEDAYQLEFRMIGVNSVLGELEYRQEPPVEVGILCIVTSSSQALSNEICKLINPFMLHYPLTETEELPTFSFPYSPAESERGAVFRFLANHRLILAEPMDGFRLEH